ncbi:hypothetical protein HaLaN_24601 [Haematococcus lacustris]|uniref:Uncharacterized protein n=1 Tax=Haematococcus lacustris TaxID=44745 RepID=A0A699ZYW5_HAELA|nr:hypothetical protein HaLaN_24601 [Haematococcus lacustris]
MEDGQRPTVQRDSQHGLYRTLSHSSSQGSLAQLAVQVSSSSVGWMAANLTKQPSSSLTGPAGNKQPSASLPTSMSHPLPHPSLSTAMAQAPQATPHPIPMGAMPWQAGPQGGEPQALLPPQPQQGRSSPVSSVGRSRAGQSSSWGGPIPLTQALSDLTEGTAQTTRQVAAEQPPGGNGHGGGDGSKGHPGLTALPSALWGAPPRPRSRRASEILLDGPVQLHELALGRVSLSAYSSQGSGQGSPGAPAAAPGQGGTTGTPHPPGQRARRMSLLGPGGQGGAAGGGSGPAESGQESSLAFLASAYQLLL